MSLSTLEPGEVAADDDDAIGSAPSLPQPPPPPPPPSASEWLARSIAYPPAYANYSAYSPAMTSAPLIDPSKAALFTSGAAPSLSVNRVEAERAAAEQKRRRQEAEARAVYDDFVASFAAEQQQEQPPQQAKPKAAKSSFTAFVRGGTIGGNETDPAAAAPATPAKRAEPHAPAPASSSTPAAVEPPWKRQRPASPPPPAAAFEAPQPPPAAPAGRGKQRNIDLFMAELRQRQAEPQAVREEAQPATDATTNVFIAGLPLSTTEADLADEMVRFGDIASVKLLYPRSEEERARSTMNGFVAYMLRRDAEDAMREMNNCAWRGHPLKLHWSKPVTLPPAPAATKASRRAAAGATGSTDVVVQLPTDASHRTLIDRLAQQVSLHGVEYEQSVLEQHSHARTQPAHAHSFLFAINSPDNVYYRWRVYSLRAGGGGLERWDTRPFQMVPHGPTWLPPVDDINVRAAVEQPQQQQQQQQSVVDEPGTGMTSGEVDELQRLLSSITLHRPTILAAMGWCMEHAAAAAFIVRSICAALLSSAESCRRVAVLFLLSDLLYNSSAPVRNASLFRREASRHDSLHGVWTAFSPHAQRSAGEGTGAAQWQRAGRREREVVLGVLRAWQRWSLFESDRIEQWMLSARGLHAAVAAPAHAAQPTPAATAATAADSVSEAVR